MVKVLLLRLKLRSEFLLFNSKLALKNRGTARNTDQIAIAQRGSKPVVGIFLEDN
jgi:hypothetical protein